jgi:alpha-D-ribose 1-methylphosphonate 5-triphosphate synthase subunit PhnL
VTRTLAIETRGLAKSFTLHAQGHIRLPVLAEIDLTVAPGECVLLDGPSGVGKSTLMRTLYGNYRPDRGQILLRHDGVMVDLAAAAPRLALELRRRTIRVPAIEIVAQPLMALGSDPETARNRAGALLERLALPQRLWRLPPATFSGGEQQRVNIARGLIAGHPILLVDEPTAALDAENGARVVALLQEARAGGAAIVAICHDPLARQALATRHYSLPSRNIAA